MPRDPALLTPSQRAFLRGEKEYEHDQSETDMRYKIRNRVRNGLFDLALLFQEMESRDREQLFKDVRPGQLRDDGHPSSDEAYREHEPSALMYALAFFYKAATDAGFDFETVVELAVVAAMGEDPANPFAARSVDVTIETNLVYDYDRIEEKLDEGDPLREAEYLALNRLFLSDLPEFKRLCQRADLNIEDKLDAGEALTRSETVVAFGRAIGEPGRFDRDKLDDCMDDHVAAELGWGTFR